MKVRIDKGEIFDGEQTPIVIIFKDDAERLHIIDILQKMQPKEGYRFFVEANKALGRDYVTELLDDTEIQLAK